MTSKKIALIASLVLALDRLTKILIYYTIAHAGPVKVIPNIFHITLVLNNGAAFGLFHNRNGFFISLSLIVISFIIFYIRKRRTPDKVISVSLGLILGGAVGNLIDRVFFGCVIDFLDFRIWPVFNIADSAISIGAAILLLSIITGKRKA